MKRTIGIVAPMFDEAGRWDSEFVLRLEEGRQELTLENIHTLLLDGSDTKRLRQGRQETATIAAEHYLTGLLRAQGYDTVATNQVDGESLRRLASASPFAVCVSTTMIHERKTLETVVARIREAMPEVAILLGGVLLWKGYNDPRLPARLQENDRRPGAPRREDPGENLCIFPCNQRDVGADVMVIAPHGAAMLLEVLQVLEKGARAELSRIPNLALPDGAGDFVFTRRITEPVDYDTDYTRWDLVDELPRYIPFRTSIGCPYDCKFCDFCHVFPDLFLRSPESMSSELDLIAKRKGRRLPIIHVTDDIVFANRRRLREVCSAVRDSRAGALWGGFLRASTFLPEETETLKDSRFVFGFMGVESGDQGQLDRMGKRQRVGILKSSIESLDHAGIHVLMTFVVGFPGETPETLANTARFQNELDVSNAAYQVYPLRVPPMSGLSDPKLRERYGLRGWGETWSHDTMDRARAEAACYDVFRGVRWVPYKYYDESVLYNRRWGPERLRKMFDLRRKLTIQLMQGDPVEEAAATLGEIGTSMGLELSSPPASLVARIAVPGLPPPPPGAAAAVN